MICYDVCDALSNASDSVGDASDVVSWCIWCCLNDSVLSHNANTISAILYMMTNPLLWLLINNDICLDDVVAGVDDHNFEE